MNTKSIYIFDSSVQNYTSIIESLPIDSVYYVLNSAEDGVFQLANIVSQFNGLEAIHLISHGNVAALNLGSTQLNNANLSIYESQLKIIGNALADTGDLLLYGCNVGQGEEGQTFIETLANLTNADVAASNDLTGDASQGGDWVLEASTGQIDTSVENLSKYKSTLLPGADVGSNAPDIYTGAMLDTFETLSSNYQIVGYGSWTISADKTLIHQGNGIIMTFWCSHIFGNLVKHLLLKLILSG